MENYVQQMQIVADFARAGAIKDSDPVIDSTEDFNIIKSETNGQNN